MNFSIYEVCTTFASSMLSFQTPDSGNSSCSIAKSRCSKPTNNCCSFSKFCRVICKWGRICFYVCHNTPHRHIQNRTDEGELLMCAKSGAPFSKYCWAISAEDGVQIALLIDCGKLRTNI